MALALTQARLRIGQAPLITLALAILVTAGVLLPPFYLLLRAAGQGSAIGDILTERATIEALGRTLVLTVTVTASCILIAVPLAWLTARTDLPLRQVWAVVLALPLAIPSFVGGFIIVSALGPGGLLQDLLEPLGVKRLPSVYGFKGAWLVLTFLSYPYVYLPVRAMLRRMDPALEEASRSLGKGPLETFLRVNLPQMRPAISAGAILVSLYVLSEFGAVSMLRFDSLTPLIYIQYTSAFDRNAAAVLGLPLMGLAALFVIIDSVTRGAARYHSSSQQRPAKTMRLGVWRWPAFFYCFLVMAIGAGIPVAVVLYWLGRGLSGGESTSFVLEAVVNSAHAAGFAAVIAVVASLPIVMLSVRHPGWLSGFLEKAAYAGYALPAITIALAFVFFAANYLPGLYQTLMLLIIAYVVRFLPQSIGTCRSALLQLNPHTEEAARSLGRGSATVFFRITLPQMLPGISASAMLVFLTAMKELPTTLLLSPIGFDTLPVRIWSASSEAFFTQAALPALILIVVSGIPVAILSFKGQQL